MDISPADWRVIRRVVRGSIYCGLASLEEDGSPNVTPIGSLALGEVGRGYYFEEYAAALARDFRRDQRICALAVNGSLRDLLWAMLRGRASRPFGVRLYGTAGERRAATPAEVERFLKRVRLFRFSRGHRLLWGRMRTVREVSFDRFEPVRIPPLGPGWPTPEQAAG